MSSPDREATINELFARLSAHEWEDAGLLTADDVEFELAYAPEFMDMPVRGRAALVNLYASILGPMFDGFTIAPDEIILGADPDVAVVTYASDATVKHNGVTILQNLELNGPTPGGKAESPDGGPLQLQGHGNPVFYRNIWVVPK